MKGDAIMKYALTEEKHPIYNAFRIMASEDNPELGIKQGDLGGYIESKDILDEDSSAWVYSDCVVIGASKISGSAVIKDGAILQNVVVGMDSSISKITLVDTMISTDLSLYGKENSIVIADKNLKYGVVTATKYTGAKTENIAVAYATFFGSLEALELYLTSGYIEGEDKDLLLRYISIIRNRFKPITV